MTRKPLLVLGAGAWGTALALVAARTGPVQLWSWDEAQVEQMTRRQENHAYLPGIMFPDSLHPTADIGIAAQTRDVLIAVPCSALRETVSRVLAASRGQSRIAWACKGFDHATCQLPSDVVQELAGTGTPLACLSGPTFAREVAEDLPAAITIATNDDAFGGDLLRIFRAGRFRPYLSTDLVGVQVGGALKNVIAIAAGICDGYRLGANSRAAIITRGLAETSRLGVAMGGRAETFMGLSGIGDLVLTCTDDQSRNRRLGVAIGRGADIVAAREQAGKVVEGMASAHTALHLAGLHGVTMPITEQVARVLDASSTIEQATSALLSRNAGVEVD